MGITGVGGGEARFRTTTTQDVPAGELLGMLDSQNPAFSTDATRAMARWMRENGFTGE